MAREEMRRRQFIGGGCLSLLTVASTCAASPSLPIWPDGTRGAVSLTYDDGLDSQLDLAVPALDALRLRATFFVTLKAIAARRPEWEALVGRGHELADHTVDHPCDLGRRNARLFGKTEIAPVERWLDRIQPNRRIKSFAYPCDVTNLGRGTPNRQERRYDALLTRLGIIVARTSEGSSNSPASVLRRPHRLQALAIGYDAPDLQAVQDYLAQAAQHGHWAIVIFHKIGPPDGDAGTVSEGLHDAILREVANGPLWCAPVDEVFRRVRRALKA